MATEATQQDVQAVALPAQQDNIVIDTKTYTLSDEEVYASMSQFGENAKPYKDTSSMKGEEFYTFKCRGAMINVSPAFQQAFKDRNIYSVTITGKPYDRPMADANNPGGNTVRREQSWTFDSFMSVDDYIETMKAKSKINKLKAAMQIDSAKLNVVSENAKKIKVTAEEEKSILDELSAMLNGAEEPAEIDDEEAA